MRLDEILKMLSFAIDHETEFVKLHNSPQPTRLRYKYNVVRVGALFITHPYIDVHHGSHCKIINYLVAGSGAVL